MATYIRKSRKTEVTSVSIAQKEQIKRNKEAAAKRAREKKAAAKKRAKK
jgi:hypothetical protein